jgi:NAD(P)-dependent dehydrogenase (short-subunit alcohol dehydrogenase family)
MSRRIIVTGSSGIAAALIRALDLRGDQVFIIGGVEEDATKLVSECKNIVGFSAVDLRDENQTEAAFALAVKKLSSITDVVAIVGGSGRKFGDGSFADISLSAWNETLALNLTTTFLTLREGLTALKNSGGSITLTGSVLATSPVADHFTTHAYATSKAAIEGMVKIAASSYLKSKIRVNAVRPGLIATPMAKRAAEDAVIQEYIKEKQPLFATQIPPESLVPAYLYLIDNPVTGEILTVDGGWNVITNI